MPCQVFFLADGIKKLRTVEADREEKQLKQRTAAPELGKAPGCLGSAPNSSSFMT